MKRLLVLFVMLVAFAGSAFAAIDINSATAEQLDALKGIGPVKAKAIVDYRTKNGPFRTIEDIKNVDGIGEATFNGIKGEITVGRGVAKTAEKAAPKPAAKAAAKESEAAVAAKGEKAAPKGEKGDKGAKDAAPKGDKAAKDAAPKSDKAAKDAAPKGDKGGKDAPRDEKSEKSAKAEKGGKEAPK